MKVSQRNAKARRALGIVDLEWEQNRCGMAIWLLTLRNGDSLRVEVAASGTTEASVLKKAAEILRDRPVRYS